MRVGFVYDFSPDGLERALRFLADYSGATVLTDLGLEFGLGLAVCALDAGHPIHVVLPYIGMTGWVPRRAGKPTFWSSGELRNDPWAVDCFDESVRAALLDDEWVPRGEDAWDSADFETWTAVLLDANTVDLVGYGTAHFDERYEVADGVLRQKADLLVYLDGDAVVMRSDEPLNRT